MIIPTPPLSDRSMNKDADIAARHRDLIVRIAQTQDKAAFGELFDWYAPRIKAMLLKQNASNDLAEDIMQDVLLNVWLKADKFAASRGTAAAWIFTIARNRRIDLFRKQSSRHYLDVDEMEFADDAPGGDDMLVASEQDGLVAEAASTLPSEMQEVIQLAFVEEKSQSEIASELGIPLGTVKSRTRRAFVKIKEQLEGVL